MHDEEFIWLVPNDDNRIADGLDVRREYFHHSQHMRGCSVLEVIIGLSRRISFMVGDNPEDWAWQLISNLGLHRMSGHIGRTRSDQIEEILQRLIWRTYERNGQGGFFPLTSPREDQRKIEIWYQMCAYVDELSDL